MSILQDAPMFGDEGLAEAELAEEVDHDGHRRPLGHSDGREVNLTEQVQRQRAAARAARTRDRAAHRHAGPRRLPTARRGEQRRRHRRHVERVHAPNARHVLAQVHW